HRIVRAVEAPLELDDQRSPGGAAGESDRVEDGLGAAHGRDDHLSRWDRIDDPASELDLEFGGAETDEVDGLHGSGSGIGDPIVTVAQEHRAEGRVVVEVATTVQVSDSGTLRRPECPGRSDPSGGGVDSTGNQPGRLLG